MPIEHDAIAIEQVLSRQRARLHEIGQAIRGGNQPAGTRSRPESGASTIVHDG
jgi:hypothetical protein